MAQVHTAGRLATHMQPSFQLLPVPLSLVQAVYHMPTSEDADPASSMPLALQSVFYKASAEPLTVPAGYWHSSAVMHLLHLRILCWLAHFRL